MGKTGPLEGIKVTEFTTAYVGPQAGFMLSQMGADVIKVENPSIPDYWRRVSTAYYERGSLNGSCYFAIINRGKKSCVLDLKEPNNLETAKRLVKASDIVLVNFAARVMDNLGLGYSVLKEVKPDIIMICASGYGATGPDRSGVAFGPTLEPYAGLSRLIGYPDGPPMSCGTTISDYLGGVMIAYAALAALHYRDLRGEGQFVDISEVEALLTIIPESIMEYTMNGRIPLPNGNRDEVMAPHGCYQCQGEDKWVAIAVGSDREWKNLCQVMGKPELANDMRFQDCFCRLKHQDDLDKIISDWALNYAPIDILTTLQKVGIAAGPVYTAEEIYKDPQLLSREFFVEHSHPEVGKKVLPGVFTKLSETPGEIRGRDPLFGEHTEWVLNELLGSNDS